LGPSGTESCTISTAESKTFYLMVNAAEEFSVGTLELRGGNLDIVQIYSNVKV
jgi:hypothetical protein